MMTASTRRQTPKAKPKSVCAAPRRTNSTATFATSSEGDPNDPTPQKRARVSGPLADRISDARSAIQTYLLDNPDEVLAIEAAIQKKWHLSKRQSGMLVLFNARTKTWGQLPNDKFCYVALMEMDKGFDDKTLKALTRTGRHGKKADDVLCYVCRVAKTHKLHPDATPAMQVELCKAIANQFESQQRILEVQQQLSHANFQDLKVRVWRFLPEDPDDKDPEARIRYIEHCASGHKVTPLPIEVKSTQTFLCELRILVMHSPTSPSRSQTRP